MPRLAIDYIRATYPEVKSIGLLATDATGRTGLYQNIADDFGLTTLVPPEPFQNDLVQKSIHLIKAGEKTQAAQNIRQVAEMLIAQGAEVIIAGCTEIPLVLENGMISVPVIDPTLILAREIVATRAGEGVFS
jgi:aspartate racemase